MAPIKLNVKLNRGLYSRDDFVGMQRVMGSYVLCKSKRSCKTFLIVPLNNKTKCWYYSNIVVCLICICFMLLMPFNKTICFLLGFAASAIMVIGSIIQRKNFLEKFQFHPLMIFDPQRQIISFYRIKDISFFQTVKKVEKFNFKDIIKVQLLYSYRIMNPDGSDVSIYCQACVFSIFTRSIDEIPIQNMIFATYDGAPICEKIANLLKEHAEISIDIQHGSAIDQYR